jgi:Arc/MetJ-type ribon-helix-helix transcriptional regulator
MANDSITVTLSSKANVEWIKSKVQDGHFASEEEAIENSVSLLREDDDEVEIWIKEVVIPRYRRHKENPTVGISSNQLLEQLDARRKQRAAQNR